MSADNWTRCPRCFKKQQTAVEKVQASYGKIPLSDYERLMDEARKQAPPEDEETLREDYEIGIYKGAFTVGYSGSCTRDGCGFSFGFKHKESVK